MIDLSAIENLHIVESAVCQFLENIKGCSARCPDCNRRIRNGKNIIVQTYYNELTIHCSNCGQDIYTFKVYTTDISEPISESEVDGIRELTQDPHFEGYLYQFIEDWYANSDGFENF